MQLRLVTAARFALVLVLGLAGASAGCDLFGQHDAAAHEDGDPYAPEPGPECSIDADCVAASSSCCECPAFALPAASNWDESCEDVQCPPPSVEECGNVAAICDEGSCALACVPVTCELVCDEGFDIDPAGCLVCACGGGAIRTECELDEDCAQVPADCCGCATGGADTAVPAADAEGFADSLDCSADEAGDCPGVNVCDPEVGPRCVRGACALTAGDGTDDVDAGAEPPPMNVQPCGTSAYPPCPEGSACVLNDPSANENGLDGVGVCVDQGS